MLRAVLVVAVAGSAYPVTSAFNAGLSELESWALLLGGFILIGGAIRGRGRGAASVIA